MLIFLIFGWSLIGLGRKRNVINYKKNFLSIILNNFFHRLQNIRSTYHQGIVPTTLFKVNVFGKLQSQLQFQTQIYKNDIELHKMSQTPIKLRKWHEKTSFELDWHHRGHSHPLFRRLWIQGWPLNFTEWPPNIMGYPPNIIEWPLDFIGWPLSHKER